MYKIDICSNFSAKDFTPYHKNAVVIYNDVKLCSYTSDEAKKLCLQSSSDTCWVCRVDVKGREIEKWKSIENKEFPGVGTVWKNCSGSRIFCLLYYAETYPLLFGWESWVDRIDMGYAVEIGLLKGVLSRQDYYIAILHEKGNLYLCWPIRKMDV